MSLRGIVLAFAAGFLATLVFHQGGLALLQAAGLTDRAPFSMNATEPFGVPQVISLAFWGGVWGIVLAALLRKRVPRGAFLLRALIFGAVFPTLVALFVVMPLKDQPLAGGGDPMLIAGALILNGLWGLGTALFLLMFQRGVSR
jgi:hypothetical protein